MEDEFETSAYPPLRTRKIDLLFVGVSFVKDVASAVTEAIGDVQQLVAMHANWQVEREQFHEQAAVELESLLAEVEDK